MIPIICLKFPPRLFVNKFLNNPLAVKAKPYGFAEKIFPARCAHEVFFRKALPC
jgi:hypothetical protein